MTADYRTARDRLGELVHSNLLNTDDAEPVYLRYRSTADDPDPVLGTIVDGELAALAEHRCDLTGLRAEVAAARDAAKDDSFFYAMEGVYDEVLDLIDKHTREGQ